MVFVPICSRSLTCIFEGTRAEVLISFEQPKTYDEAYGCRFEISFVDHPIRLSTTIFGEDSLQELQLALFNAGALLPTLKGASNWRWNDRGDLGFPIKI